MNSTDTSLFDRNLAALAQRFPDLHDTMAAMGATSSSIVGTLAGGDLNLDLGHTRLYGGDAASFSAQQVETFRRKPDRVYMEPPARLDLGAASQYQYYVSEALYTAFGDRLQPPIPATPTRDTGGYLLVYGIGLGLHLPPLFAETPVRHFILIDEHLEFFRHTLSLIDWTEILENLAANGQTLHFIFGRDAGIVGDRVHWYIRGRGFGLIDGSYLFRHYSSALLDLAHRDFVAKLPLLAISIGFFEDEMVMLDQATANLMRYDFDFLEAKPRLQKDLPAIIVGSGPSLDRTIEHLRRISGQAIIFSAGTALQPLLRAGIRPDFHCELENGWGSVVHLQRTAANFDLDGITLIASTTVHPELPSLFKSRVFYFRDSVCSTPLWCPGGLGIFGTAPTCTNLALRAALILAFRDVYLFGVDLGTRDAGEHHAKGTLYHEDADWIRHAQTDPMHAMTIEMPGNFGGKAYTNPILHWARMMMAQAIDAFSFARIYNCSDGVNVPGTLPKLAQTIRLSVPPGRKGLVLRRLHHELDPKQPGEMAPQSVLRGARRQFREYYADVRAEIRGALQNKPDFISFYDTMHPYLEHRGPRPFQNVLRATNIGVMMMCFQIGYYFWRRVAAEERPAMMEVFLTALDERVAAMADTVEEVISRHDTADAVTFST